jgi:hypothetical protein
MWIQGVVYIAILVYMYKVCVWFGMFVLNYTSWKQLYLKSDKCTSQVIEIMNTEYMLDLSS